MLSRDACAQHNGTQHPMDDPPILPDVARHLCFYIQDRLYVPRAAALDADWMAVADSELVVIGGGDPSIVLRDSNT